MSAEVVDFERARRSLSEEKLLIENMEQELDPPSKPSHHLSMTDSPTRPEIDAKLEAAEARTETRLVALQGDIDRRFTEMSAEMEMRFSGVERRIDKLVDAAEGWAREMRDTRQTVVSENKSTRLNLWIVAVSSVIAVGLGLYSIHSLSIATQANMIAIFQAGQSAPKPNP